MNPMVKVPSPSGAAPPAQPDRRTVSRVRPTGPSTGGPSRRRKFTLIGSILLENGDRGRDGIPLNGPFGRTLASYCIRKGTEFTRDWHLEQASRVPRVVENSPQRGFLCSLPQACDPWQPVSITRNLRGARRFVKWIRQECKAGSVKRGQCANGLGWRAVAVRDAITQILLAHLVRPTMTED